MRSRSTLFAVLFIVLVIVLGVWLYQYWSKSRKFEPGLEARQEYQIALSDVSSKRWSEPIASFVGISILAFFLAALRIFRHSSITRNLLTAFIVTLGVFAVYANLMDGDLKQHNAAWVVSPDVVIDCFYWAALGSLLTLVFWFVIERLYVRFGIARHA